MQNSSYNYPQARPLSFALSLLVGYLLLPCLINARRIHERLPTFDYSPDILVRRTSSKPLKISNQCDDVIYPGIVTQAGTGPDMGGGFKLDAGEEQDMTVSSDWQGRIWGRTNCSFNDAGTGPSNHGGLSGGGQSCTTGDCNGVVNCLATGATPVTLAEFTLDSPTSQTYYDISLVDGYNLPLAIVYIPSSNQTLSDVPPNLTNPVCIGTADLLAAPGTDTSPAYLGTNATYPGSFDQKALSASVQRWCPWDLQLSPPTKPGNGVYPYPDDNIQRPPFNPCYSACAKTNAPTDCCTGAYDSPQKCKPSLYSRNAKSVCPDAYSYAYDDATSTFIIPSGGGFQVIFCPSGRSTNILTVNAEAVSKLSQNGGTKVSPTFKNDAPGKPDTERSSIIALALLVGYGAWWIEGGVGF